MNKADYFDKMDALVKLYIDYPSVLVSRSLVDRVIQNSYPFVLLHEVLTYQ